MNEALELVKQFAEQVGKTVEYAWPLMVQHHWAKYLGGLIAGGIGTGLLLSLTCACFVRGFKANDEYVGGGCFALVITILLLVITLTTALPDVLYPEAGLIRMLIGK